MVSIHLTAASLERAITRRDQKISKLQLKLDQIIGVQVVPSELAVGYKLVEHHMPVLGKIDCLDTRDAQGRLLHHRLPRRAVEFKNDVYREYDRELGLYFYAFDLEGNQLVNGYLDYLLTTAHDREWEQTELNDPRLMSTRASWMVLLVKLTPHGNRRYILYHP